MVGKGCGAPAKRAGRGWNAAGSHIPQGSPKEGKGASPPASLRSPYADRTSLLSAPFSVPLALHRAGTAFVFPLVFKVNHTPAAIKHQYFL